METRPLISPIFRAASPLGGLLVGALGAVIGTILRRHWIEPVEIGAICESTPAPGWCDLRLAVLDAAAVHLVGLTALALALASTALPRGAHRLPAHLALFGAGVGIVLYDATAGAAAAVVALLVLVERRERPVRGSSARAIDEARPMNR